jgi:hypothetical protein
VLLGACRLHDSKYGERPSAPPGATERAVSSPSVASTRSENVVALRVFDGRVDLQVCHHVPANAAAGSVRTALRTPARLARTPTTTAITGKTANAPIV